MKMTSRHEETRGKPLAGIRSRAVKIAVSSRTALYAFLVSAVLLGLLLWRERDQCGSYFTQTTIWTPPLLVISSDDWGGAIPPETIEDLDRLRDVLKSVTDAQGKPLVLTVYMNPAEPDFESIVASGYTSYSYRYCYRDKPQVAARLRELHEAGLIDIQFHGREHYNIPLWLSLLKEDRPGFRNACLAGRVPWREGPGWDVQTDPRLPFLRQSFLDASSYPPKSLSVAEQQEMIASGLAMMKDEFGVTPMVFTPPGYGYDINTLHAMSSAKIPFLDSVERRIPMAADNKDQIDSPYRWGWTEEIAGIRGIVRNVSFEPYKGKSLAATMREARRALLSGKPIVVSSHRWNYVESVNPNRDRDLRLLQEFAAQIRDEAPDVIFASAADLVSNLYLGGAGTTQQDMILREKELSGTEKMVHALRCIWMGHIKIRAASSIALLSLLWFSAAEGLRRRFHKAQEQNGYREPAAM